jgi:hypothetical protein
MRHFKIELRGRRCRDFLLVCDRQYLRAAFELARLGFDAWTVVGLRTLRLGAGGRAASLEAQRMIVEKTATMLKAQAAMTTALMSGCSPRATARKVIAPYRRRVTANRTRLMRKA